MALCGELALEEVASHCGMMFRTGKKLGQGRHFATKYKLLTVMY